MVRALTKTHRSWDPHTNKPVIQCCIRLLLHIAQSNQRALFWVEWSRHWPKHTAVRIYTLLCKIHLQVTTTWSENQSEGSISLLPWRLWCHKRNLAGKGAFSRQNHFLRVHTFGCSKLYFQRDFDWIWLSEPQGNAWNHMELHWNTPSALPCVPMQFLDLQCSSMQFPQANLIKRPQSPPQKEGIHKK